MASSFHVNRNHNHLKWSNTIQPVLTVDSGAVVSFDTLDGSNRQITRTSTVSDVLNFDVALADPVFGPVFIHDAEPGDTLQIEFLDLKPASWGWTAIVPGFGLLSDEFPQPSLKIWDLPEGASHAVFRDDILIPMRPFLGEVGVAPGEPGEYSTIPPRDTGGNIDCRHITQGSKLFLPVRAPGALFSCGDGHAAQGDGEVCGSAIETPMKATVRLTVLKGCEWVNSPHFTTSVRVNVTKDEDKGTYGAMGVDPDMKEAARKAVRGLCAWLMATKGLNREDSYMLASVAADLRVIEAVDMPTYVVAAALPLSIFRT